VLFFVPLIEVLLYGQNSIGVGWRIGKFVKFDRCGLEDWQIRDGLQGVTEAESGVSAYFTGGDSGIPWGAKGCWTEPWDEEAARETVAKLDSWWHRRDVTAATSATRGEPAKLPPGHLATSQGHPSFWISNFHILGNA
jgi:hypothetical protein